MSEHAPSDPNPVLPWWKRMPEAVVRHLLTRSWALRNLTDILHKLAFPLPPFERFYRDHMRRLLDRVAETNPLDEQGRSPSNFWPKLIARRLP